MAHLDCQNWLCLQCPLGPDCATDCKNVNKNRWLKCTWGRLEGGTGYAPVSRQTKAQLRAERVFNGR